MRISDWSSDVCSSDLGGPLCAAPRPRPSTRSPSSPPGVAVVAGVGGPPVGGFGVAPDPGPAAGPSVEELHVVLEHEAVAAVHVEGVVGGGLQIGRAHV